MLLGKIDGDNDFPNKYLPYFVWGTIALGLILRFTVYLQFNSMYIDEANIARNIYERSFGSLALPLSYEQYAPPFFLWIVKACTVLFGYGEGAYRLYPLFCGLSSLCLSFFVLKRYSGFRGIWYVLLLLSFGPLYVQYACTTKQYVPDMLITLALVWLALTNTLSRTSSLRLFLLWTIAGTISIWSSMPSVFVLAGVGGYYFLIMFRGRDFSKLWFLLSAGIFWFAQFVLYYFLILKPQANSDYLQNFHKEYFFYAPTNLEKLSQDIDLLLIFISTAGGHQVLSLIFNGGCILIGIAYLNRTKDPGLLLLVIPLLAVIFAAAIHQYSLIPRLTLFAMPLLLILISVGLEQVIQTRYFLIQVLIIILAFICVANFNTVGSFVRPLQTEEMKLSLQYLKKEKIKGSELYVQHLAAPAYIYYTQIHPEKNDLASLKGASILGWNTNCDSLAKTFPLRAAMLYSWDSQENISAQQTPIRRNVTLVDSNIVKGGRVYIYRRI